MNLTEICDAIRDATDEERTRLARLIITLPIASRTGITSFERLVEYHTDEPIPPARALKPKYRFTPALSAVLDMADEVARGMGDNYIGTDHVMIAMHEPARVVDAKP